MRRRDEGRKKSVLKTGDTKLWHENPRFMRQNERLGNKIKPPIGKMREEREENGRSHKLRTIGRENQAEKKQNEGNEE